MEAVMAGRGVLMTVEGTGTPRTRQPAVPVSRSRPRCEIACCATKKSILVRDAQLDQHLRQHMSIVEQKVAQRFLAVTVANQ